MILSRSFMVTGDTGRVGMARFSSVDRVNVEAALFGLLGLLLDVVQRVGPLAILSRQHRLRNCPRQTSEDRLQAADYGLEQADAAPQRPINVSFDCALVMQVDDSNLIVPLTEAVDTADAAAPSASGSTAYRS